MSNENDMRFLTRQEFANHYNQLKPGLGDPDSPLWIPDPEGNTCRFFIRVPKPVGANDDYHSWCERHLDGLVRCFSSSEDAGEWWGFTNKDDIVMWTLKWG